MRLSVAILLLSASFAIAQVNIGGTSVSYLSATTNGMAQGQNYTVMAWVNPNRVAMDIQLFGGWIISERSTSAKPGTLDFQFFYSSKTKDYRFGLYTNNSTTAINLKSPTSSVVLAWTHLAATVSSTEGIVRLYVNGVIENQSNFVGVANDGSGNTRIGAHGWDETGTPLIWRGGLQDVRCYKRVLSPSEIFYIAKQDPCAITADTNLILRCCVEAGRNTGRQLANGEKDQNFGYGNLSPMTWVTTNVSISATSVRSSKPLQMEQP